MLAGIISKTTIFKTSINILALILSNLINKSLTTGLFPNSLKRAKILTIFKNKDKFNITNCRGISIPHMISKVYEKVFYNSLYNYFSFNNLLSSSQFDFRSGASTKPVLLKYSDDILKLFDQKKVASATFMDLSKAFDCVYHNILLYYYLISNDMTSMKLHCNGSIVTCQTVNILYLRTILTHLQ